MSRELQFDRADIDTGLFNDVKVRRLHRRLKDPHAINAAIVTYVAVVLASWDAHERVTAEDAAPPWMLDPVIDPLVEVGLLDREGRIPAHAWLAWFGPAVDRRLTSQRKAMFGGLRRQGLSTEAANREADRRIAEVRAAYCLKAEPSRSSLRGQPQSIPSQSIPSQPGMDGEMDTAAPAPDGGAARGTENGATDATSGVPGGGSATSSSFADRGFKKVDEDGHVLYAGPESVGDRLADIDHEP